MTANSISEPAPDRTTYPAARKRKLGPILVLVWLTLLCLYFSWEGITGSGLVGWLEEWQFYQFDKAFVPLTRALAIALFALPVFLIWNRRRAQSERSTVPRIAAFRSAHRLMVALAAIIVALLISALALALAPIMLLQFQKTPQMIDLASPAESSLDEGLTVIRGKLLLNAEATVNDFIAARNSPRHYAPIIGPDVKEPLRYFVELPQGRLSKPREPIDISVSGYLQMRQFSDAVGVVYRKAGYPVAKHNYVLFKDRTSLVWRNFYIALQFTVAALIGAVFLYFQRRHFLKLRHREHTPEREPESDDVYPRTAPAS